VEKSGLRKRIEAAEAERQLQRDILLTRQRTGLDINTREDMLAAVGRPVSAGAPVLSNITAAEAAHLADASREKFAPSYNALWDRTFEAWASERESAEYIAGQARNWKNHVRDSDIANLPINRVTEEEAKLFIGQLSLGVDGKRKIKQHFARLSRGAFKQSWISFCPFEDVKIKAPRTVEDDPTKFYHPANEYPLILEYARDEDAREYFGFSMGCGPRPNEGKAFRWEDINLAGKKLTFRFGREGSPTKGGKPLTVDMLPEAERWLIHRINRLHGGSQPTDGVIFGKTGGKKKGKAYARGYTFHLNATLKAAGIEPQARGLYGFRHGFCTSLANGFYGPGWEDASKAKKLMRHKKLETTLIYYHVLDETVEEKAKQSKAITNPDDFPPKADGAFGADPFSNEDDFRGSERANPSESFPKEKGRSGTDRPFWKFANLATSLLVVWLCGCEYVAFTTTDFVWISNRSSMVGLFSLSCFARHVSARCIPRREAC
jgi:integrase